LVELACVSLDPRDVGAVLAHDRYSIAELVPKHHQRALEAFRHVGLLPRRAVHLRVRLDGGDEFGDAPGRLLHL